MIKDYQILHAEDPEGLTKQVQAAMSESWAWRPQGGMAVSIYHLPPGQQYSDGTTAAFSFYQAMIREVLLL